MLRSVNLHGNPFALIGPEIKVGDTAPGAKLRKDLGSDFDLNQLKGKLRIYSIVPSLDTPVCAAQTKRFNEEVSSIPQLNWVTISCDLPVAMKRFCGDAGIDSEKNLMLSDHKELNFGHSYGTLIPELRILCRAVFVIKADDKVIYAEYVPEMSNHPNYDAVITALREI